MGTIEIATILSLLLVIPFLGWGVYLLRLQLVHRVEIPHGVAALTLAALLLFYMFEIALLQVWLNDYNWTFAGSVVSLSISGLALYGPMLSSLASHALVVALIPTGERPELTPHYGSAEQYERLEDYQAALEAYLAVARMFPTDPTTLLRVGAMLQKLGRYEEAVEWYERSLTYVDDSETALNVTNRLVEVYSSCLNQPKEAIHVLEQYKNRYPHTPYAQTVENRIERLEARSRRLVRKDAAKVRRAKDLSEATGKRERKAPGPRAPKPQGTEPPEELPGSLLSAFPSTWDELDAEDEGLEQDAPTPSVEEGGNGVRESQRLEKEAEPPSGHAAADLPGMDLAERPFSAPPTPPSSLGGEKEASQDTADGEQPGQPIANDQEDPAQERRRPKKKHFTIRAKANPPE